MISNPLAVRLVWRRVVTSSPLRGYTSSLHRPLYTAGRFGPGARIVVGVSLLAVAIIAFALAPAVHAQPNDDGRAAPRLLIAEMEALTASVGKLSGAVAKADFETANGHLATINRNWPGIRADLKRRGESGIISDFESAMSGVGTAIEAADQETASAEAGRLQQALDRNRRWRAPI